MPKKEFKSELKEIYGFLNEKESILCGSISYNDKEPKFNIRSCVKDEETGELKPMKGIALTETELDNLYDILTKYKTTGKFPKVTKDGKKAVDFDSVFDDADEIIEKRAKGLPTRNGFIYLSDLRKPGSKLP